MEDHSIRAAVRERYGRPRDVVEIKDVTRPAPEDDQVLVRVRAASLNRADYYSARPFFLFRKAIGGAFRAPRTHGLGTDFAGVVEAVGAGVTAFGPGDEVFGARSGAFGEYVAARLVARKPAHVSFEAAACVPVAALTALQALRDKGELQPGQSVLVNGASGAVGPFAVQVAKALGAARVTAVCSARNVEQTRALGADHVIDYTQQDFTTSGERYDVVVDIAATKPWRRLRRALQPGGRYVLVGAPGGGPLLGPAAKLGRLWLAGRLGGGRLVFFVTSFNEADLETVRELLDSGTIAPVVERAYPLEQAADALEYLGEGHARAKLVLTV
jgi:NADPH:quinone reductase-like Zn-dependent oxidoreductase